MIYNNIAFNAVLSLVGILVLLFLFLLGYTLWTRLKKQYWQRHEQKFRNHYSPLLFDFIEGSARLEEADKLISNLSKYGRDISFFLKLIDEMRELLKGEERTKLNTLLEHKRFYDYYRAGLFSFSWQRQLMACLYFKKVNGLGPQIIERLESLSESKRLRLSFAASKALQASEESRVRKRALVRFFKRQDPSGLMVSELLESFYRDGQRSQEVVLKDLKDILGHADIEPLKKKLVVLFLADKNFFESGNFLFDYLNQLEYSAAQSPLICGLIEALGYFQVERAAPVIRAYFQADDEELQLCCVWSLGNIGGEENMYFLMKRLLKVSFQVRKSIIEILADNKQWGVGLLNKFIASNRELISKYRNQKQHSENISPSIRRIYNTAVGIRIMLSQNQKTTPYV